MRVIKAESGRRGRKKTAEEEESISRLMERIGE